MCPIPWNYFQSKYIKAFARFFNTCKIYWRRIHTHIHHHHHKLTFKIFMFTCGYSICSMSCLHLPCIFYNIHVFVLHAMPKDIYLLIYTKLQVFGRFWEFRREKKTRKYSRWVCSSFLSFPAPCFLLKKNQEKASFCVSIFLLCL